MRIKCCDNYQYVPEYTHTKCGSCRAVTLDGGSEWGIGKRKTFKNMDYAKFYIKNGKRVDDDFKEISDTDT